GLLTSASKTVTPPAALTCPNAIIFIQFLGVFYDARASVSLKMFTLPGIQTVQAQYPLLDRL
ncbi:hypothetical protein, partial [Deinococcus sp. GbtcB9]|uniref:hypothetical protein n=1 Tax=Deinococcus sp. GbtcB9 TaxID=2824754 RepID=UPI001C2FA9AF